MMMAFAPMSCAFFALTAKPHVPRRTITTLPLTSFVNGRAATVVHGRARGIGGVEGGDHFPGERGRGRHAAERGTTQEVVLPRDPGRRRDGQHLHAIEHRRGACGDVRADPDFLAVTSRRRDDLRSRHLRPELAGSEVFLERHVDVVQPRGADAGRLVDPVRESQAVRELVHEDVQEVRLVCRRVAVEAVVPRRALDAARRADVAVEECGDVGTVDQRAIRRGGIALVEVDAGHRVREGGRVDRVHRDAGLEVDLAVPCAGLRERAARGRAGKRGERAQHRDGHVALQHAAPELQRAAVRDDALLAQRGAGVSADGSGGGRIVEADARGIHVDEDHVGRLGRKQRSGAQDCAGAKRLEGGFHGLLLRKLFGGGLLVAVVRDELAVRVARDLEAVQVAGGAANGGAAVGARDDRGHRTVEHYGIRRIGTRCVVQLDDLFRRGSAKLAGVLVTDDLHPIHFRRDLHDRDGRLRRYCPSDSKSYRCARDEREQSGMAIHIWDPLVSYETYGLYRLASPFWGPPPSFAGAATGIQFVNYFTEFVKET
nr:hypothetical protein [uncultured bacterium]